jgi:predicted alpha/beta superfamily hydrolase
VLIKGKWIAGERQKVFQDSQFTRHMIDANRYVPPGSDHTLTGDFRMHSDFGSQFLPTARNILVYLPPGYDSDSARRFPVLYLNDGQNLFDGATSFVPGHEWGVDETANDLITTHLIEPLIIVGIYNTGEHRFDEYTPTADPRLKKGGKADLYGRLLVEEVKPFIDASYRTQTSPNKTGLGGSSLGGLVSIHLGLRYPTVFGKLIAMSPSVWWDRGAILREVRSLRIKPSTRIWLDIGMKEGAYTLRNIRALRDALISGGWRLGDDLSYFEANGEQHNELAWGKRVGPALQFLFPAPRPDNHISLPSN